MNGVALFLLTVAGIFLIGVAGEIVFRRTRIPDALWLILAGILLGPVAGLLPRAQLLFVAPYFAALTLVVILFEGGSRLRITEVVRGAPRSLALALLTFTASVVVVTLAVRGASAIGWLPSSWTWMHAVLLGAILGGSSYIVIMPAMLQARASTRLANLVGLESAFTDILCVVTASAVVDILVNREGAGAPLVALGRSFGIGLGIGVVAGGLWFFLLGWLRESEHAYPVTLAGLFILYVIVERAGGSPALGVLTFAVVLGNASWIGTRARLSDELDIGHEVRGVHRQLVFIIKSFFFTFIGAMLGPPWGLFAFGLLLAGLLLAVRLPTARFATAGRTYTPVERRVAAVSLPRGLAAGVLATLPAAAGAPDVDGLPAVVFPCVFATLVIFAVGFPWATGGAALDAEAPVEAGPAGAAAGAADPTAADPTAAGPAEGEPPPAT